MYEVFLALLEKKGVKASDVAKATGVSQATLSDWKRGKSKPKAEKLQKIADYFGVTVEYLTTGNESEGYYISTETARMAQEIFLNPDLRALFEAARDSSPRDLKTVADLLKRFKETNEE